MDADLKRQIDESLAPFIRRARENGRSLAEEIDALAHEGRPYSPAERAAVSAFSLSRFTEQQPSLTLDEIREGLM